MRWTIAAVLLVAIATACESNSQVAAQASCLPAQNAAHDYSQLAAAIAEGTSTPQDAESSLRHMASEMNDSATGGASGRLQSATADAAVRFGRMRVALIENHPGRAVQRDETRLASDLRVITLTCKSAS
jgi:hypothetical protein